MSATLPSPACYGAEPCTAPPRRYHYAVWLAGFCAFLNLYGPQSLLPLFSQIFHASAACTSLLITVSTVAVAMSAPLAGWIADAVGHRRFIVFSMVGLGMATVMTATASTLGTMLFWRGLQGMFVPGIVTGTVAIVGEEWAGSGMGRAIAGYVTATVVGGFCGRFLGGVLAEFLGWRVAFLALGALTLGGASVARRWLPPPRPRDRKRDAAIGLFGRDLVVAYAIGFTVLFSLVGTFTYVTYYLAAPPFSLGPAALGAIFCVYLVGVVVTPASGRLIEAIGNRAALMAATVVALSGIILALVPHLPAVVVGLTLLSSGVFVSQAAATGFVARSAGRARGAAAGVYTGCYYAGGSVGAFAPGLLWATGGWPACVALIALVQLVTLALAQWAWRKQPPPGELGAPREGLSRLQRPVVRPPFHRSSHQVHAPETPRKRPGKVRMRTWPWHSESDPSRR